MTRTPAGWYTDPEQAGVLRWWDGSKWTDDRTTPGTSPTETTPSGDPPSPNEEQNSVQIPSAVLAKPRGGLFSGGKKALEQENAELRRAFEAIGVVEREQVRSDLARLAAERASAEAELAQIRAEIITTNEMAILQEVGIYEYRHPLDSAVAFKEELGRVRDQIRMMAKTQRAVVGATNWQVNGSVKEGARMVRDFSKLMLRAYNNEADNAVRTMKPHALASAVERLQKARSTISKLGKTMQIQVTDSYHTIRVRELELTADFLAKVAEEKEHEREERARLREEEQARREYEREKARLAKEAAHHRAALEALKLKGDDPAAVVEAEAKLAELDSAIQGVEFREANTRAGYVYVISNIGSFGDGVVKIGMTRRLDPMERVRELGDASVPFRYDVHSIIFSEDAVALELKLHGALAEQRVNMVNLRREFFHATPIAVRDLLADFEGNLLSFEETPEALEWHQTENARQELVRATP